MEDRAWKIRVGEVFRVPHGAAPQQQALRSYLQLTRGTCARPADLQKGMFFYASVTEPGHNFRRLPAFIFLTNPHKKDSESMPWIDIVEPDVGYALFHGDNRMPGRPYIAGRGNQKFDEVQHFYVEPELRMFAPPILMFAQKDVSGIRKGYREFCGYGIPIRCTVTTQREKTTGKYFTNLAIELALLHLKNENEFFDWAWIDARRNGSISQEQVLKFSPSAWRDWVRNGNSSVERCRRNVAKNNILKQTAQAALSPTERDILKDVHAYYANEKHPFEGLASYVATRIIGHACKRGWVTKRSGDMGIDFVCRLDIGDPGAQLSRAPIVVLGQAKCQKNPVSAKDLARVVARLQRGWMGVYVTTSVFSEPAQLELAEDRYPLVLINGKRLAQELERAIVSEGMNLLELLERETQWYNLNEKPYSAGRIVEDSVFASQSDVLIAKSTGAAGAS